MIFSPPQREAEVCLDRMVDGGRGGVNAPWLHLRPAGLASIKAQSKRPISSIAKFEK